MRRLVSGVRVIPQVWWLARRLAAVRLALVALLAGLLLASPGITEPSGGRGQAPRPIGQALFGSSAQGPWQPVPLPDTWAQRGQARPAMGWYRIRLDLPGAEMLAESPVWALRAERVLSRHRIWLNDLLLHDSLHGPAGRGQPEPLLLQLPPAWLQPGENWLTLQVDGGLRAGLSMLWLGPAAALEGPHRRYVALTVNLPQQLNLAAIGACLFALLLWWHRRSETAMGWFGLLGLLASLRNQAYYLPSPGWPPVLTSALFFAAQVATATMLGLFAMSLTGQRPRLYRRLLLTSAALMLAAGGLASFDSRQALDQVRTVAYPLLSLLMLPALLLIGRRVRSMRGGELAALLAAMAVVVVAGGHDYLVQQGRLAITATWWLPLATPLLVLAFAGLMVGRVVQAMSQVEVLNQTLEHRVHERTQALATANTAKSRFLAAASHDLRQPVVTIGLLVGLLREQLLAPAQRRLVAKVDEAVAAMESLLAGLLDLSRLDSGELRSRPQRVALQPLFDAVAAHERDVAQRKALRLRVRPTPLVAWADPVLLEQVVRNLVSNAVRYTDRGGVLLAARRGGGGGLRLQVWDTGRGIAEAEQAAVFEEFVQLGNPQRDRSQGLGLGLAIVQRSAALLGAALTLRSVPGRGSCFSLALPLADGPAAGRPAPPGAERWLAGRRVLLVEDDPAVRDAMQSRLQAWGAEVQALDGLHALSAALDSPDAPAPPQRRADLLITDLRLPGGSGYDVVALARSRLGPLPVLVVTGNTAPADIAVLNASGLAVLHKPFRAEQLHAAISEVLAAPHAG